MVGQVPGDDVVGCDARDVRGAAEAHHHLQLVLQHVNHADDALLTVGGERIKHRAADAAGRGAQGHRLENVGAPADAAVDEDGEVLRLVVYVLQCLHHLWQHLDARPAGVQLPAAVVGEHQPVDARLVCLHGVLPALHALQEDLHLGDGLEPGHVRPVEARVDVATDRARGALRAVHLALVLVVPLHVGALLGELVAHVLLAPPELRRVHGDEEGTDALLLELLHVLLRP
mmetsp:Transcript_40565/g.113601  ORF Transcript_40565/g.113601 Transcript_40565/m.113601 type:complete len:230 (+) Transcript_40565:195-884(+)